MSWFTKSEKNDYTDETVVAKKENEKEKKIKIKKERKQKEERNRSGNKNLWGD